MKYSGTANGVPMNRDTPIGDTVKGDTMGADCVNWLIICVHTSESGAPMLMFADDTALLLATIVSMVSVPLNAAPSGKVPLSLNTVSALALSSPTKLKTSMNSAAVSTAKPTRIDLAFANIGSPFSSG